jgi:hypothetical protein
MEFNHGYYSYRKRLPYSGMHDSLFSIERSVAGVELAAGNGGTDGVVSVPFLVSL